MRQVWLFLVKQRRGRRFAYRCLCSFLILFAVDRAAGMFSGPSLSVLSYVTLTLFLAFGPRERWTGKLPGSVLGYRIPPDRRTIQ